MTFIACANCDNMHDFRGKILNILVVENDFFGKIVFIRIKKDKTAKLRYNYVNRFWFAASYPQLVICVAHVGAINWSDQSKNPSYFFHGFPSPHSTHRSVSRPRRLCSPARRRTTPPSRCICPGDRRTRSRRSGTWAPGRSPVRPNRRDSPARRRRWPTRCTCLPISSCNRTSPRPCRPRSPHSRRTGGLATPLAWSCGNDKQRYRRCTVYSLPSTPKKSPNPVQGAGEKINLGFIWPKFDPFSSTQMYREEMGVSPNAVTGMAVIDGEKSVNNTYKYFLPLWGKGGGNIYSKILYFLPSAR